MTDSAIDAVAETFLRLSLFDRARALVDFEAYGVFAVIRAADGAVYYTPLAAAHIGNPNRGAHLDAAPIEHSGEHDRAKG